MPHDPARAYEELIGRNEVPVELPFYMNIASETDAALAPAADSSVFILVPLPHPSHIYHGDWLPLQEKIKQQIFQRLDRHGIKLSPADIILERVMTPTDWEERFGLFEGSAFGAAHTLFQMGTFRYPNRDRKIKGLYYTGASTTPGTGSSHGCLKRQDDRRKDMHGCLLKNTGQGNGNFSVFTVGGETTVSLPPWHRVRQPAFVFSVLIFRDMAFRQHQGNGPWMK